MMGKTVVLNVGRLNYDGALDLHQLSPHITLYDHSSTDEILERVAGHDIVVTKELPISAELLAQFPDSVKLLCEAGTGYNNIPLDAARAKGITVCNIPAYSTQRVAHTAILLMLALSSSMQKQQSMLTRGDKSNFTKYLQVEHVELNGKTLGLIGTGNIGRNVAKIAQAMEMTVLAYARTPRADCHGIHYVSMDELLEKSDYISLHCPLNAETEHLIDSEKLTKMKPSAFLINTARGALVDEKALIHALDHGIIAGAGLDVQEVEPPALDSPLYSLDNVILTPHMGWKGLETRQRLISILSDNITHYLKGTPINVVS